LTQNFIFKSALRHELNGEFSTQCRCDNRKVPYLTDIELDKYLNLLPKTQLVVLSCVEAGYVTIFVVCYSTFYYSLKELFFIRINKHFKDISMISYFIPFLFHLWSVARCVTELQKSEKYCIVLHC